MIVIVDGGGSRRCKHIHVVKTEGEKRNLLLNFNMHVTVSLLPFKYDGGERWDLCWRVGELAKEVVSGSS